MLLDDVNDIPEERVFMCRYSCWQRHPGLCLSKHADVYQEALTIARSFERHFTPSDVGKHFMVSDPHTTTFAFLMYLAEHRQRRPHAQQRLVFLECIATGGDYNFASGVAVAYAEGHRQHHDFLYVWALARTVLTFGSNPIVHVRQLKHKRCDDRTTIMVSFDPNILADQAHPHIRRQAVATPSEDPRLVALSHNPEKKPGPVRAQSGGIRVTVGIPKLTHASPVQGQETLPVPHMHPDVFVELTGEDDPHSGLLN